MAVKAYVLRRADGTCEGCGNPAPFTTSAGRPYLERHHTRRLSDGGPDHPAWVIGLCPTCHRRAHYAGDGEVFNETLIATANALEGSGTEFAG
jgi:5-methylcytosine-specific restriction protein A